MSARVGEGKMRRAVEQQSSSAVEGETRSMWQRRLRMGCMVGTLNLEQEVTEAAEKGPRD
jgi:hypothetical protein